MTSPNPKGAIEVLAAEPGVVQSSERNEELRIASNAENIDVVHNAESTHLCLQLAVMHLVT